MTRALRRYLLDRRKAQVQRQYADWLAAMSPQERVHWVGRRAQMRGACSCVMCREMARVAAVRRDALAGGISHHEH